MFQVHKRIGTRNKFTNFTTSVTSKILHRENSSTILELLNYFTYNFHHNFAFHIHSFSRSAKHEGLKVNLLICHMHILRFGSLHLFSMNIEQLDERAVRTKIIYKMNKKLAQRRMTMFTRSYLAWNQF